MESTDENMMTVEDSESAVSIAETGKILSESADDEIRGAENDLDELSANPGTYSGLSSEIGSGGNIVLAHDYYTYDNGSTILISIDNSVIDGNGAIIDMDGSNIRAFNVIASGVTIKNLTIKNGDVTENNCGAVYFEKTGVVENCNFFNNKAENDDGAIFFAKQGTVINCNFMDNQAESSGGAIRFGGKGNLINCNFIDNRAEFWGGAVYFAGQGNVSNCNFTDNHATSGWGGAIYFENVGGDVANCNFVNNTAPASYVSGGAISFYCSEGHVTNCNFTNNFADFGGAVYFKADGDVTNCIFVNNNADSDGGAVYFNSNGVEYPVEYVNGTAVVNTNKTAPVLPETVVVDGKEYPIEYVNGTATVTTEPVELIGTVIESEYKFTRQANDWDAGERGALFYAVLKDINGNPLANMNCLVAVNGPIYNVTTDSKGRFGVQINLARANTYTYALSFLGNDKYSVSFNSTKLILTAKKTSISASNKVFKAKATKTISVTLKTVKNPYDGKTYLYKGKKITLKINGKTYTAKTNAKGVAKFKIKLTKKGKYTAKIKFAGDKTYKASSKSIKVTIK